MITDFHSHILPNVDDGSDSVETSVQMLKLCAEQGITRVIATPHFYPQSDKPQRFLERRANSEALLRAEMAKHEGLPEVVVGAEVYYFRGIAESDILPGLTIGGKKCILIEMPNTKWTDYMYRDLADIWHKRGLIPVVAHLDRYLRPWHAKADVQRLEEMPVYIQMNAEAFLDRSMAKRMLRLMRNGNVHLLGSDCHDMQSRKPNLDKAMQKITESLGEDALTQVQRWESKVLAD